MSIGPPERRGLKLTELIVVILLVGTAFGHILRALSVVRESGRRVQCQNNMRQLGLGLLNFLTSKNRFPNAGTFFDDPRVHQGDPTRSAIYRSIADPGAFTADSNPWLRSWVVDVMPYLDAPDEAWVWDRTRSYLNRLPNTGTTLSNFDLCSTRLGVLQCPDAPGAGVVHENLTYVANGGFVRWPAVPIGWTGGRRDGQSKNGGVLEWTAPARPWEESQAACKKMGVMFLGTQTGDQPWDIATSANDLVDGASATLLLGENSLAGYSLSSPYSGGVVTNWGCPLPNFCMFLGSDDVCHTPTSTTACLGGQLKPFISGRGTELGPGWANANHPKSYERMNYGQNLTVEGPFPFVSSGHRGGANFVFCDGATRFIADTIDGRVYARLITPAGSALPGPLLQPKDGPNLLDRLD